MSQSACVNSPAGWVQIKVENGYVCALDYVEKNTSSKNGDEILRQACAQMQAYNKQADSGFDLPLQLSGTPFQQKVWHALCDIPPGQVMTYGELAKNLKSSPRAVGGACRANPLPIIVPCHRVVARNSLGGYSGATSGANMNIKMALLRHEGVEIPGLNPI